MVLMGAAISLSVNLNKIAWLRNARQGGRPSVVAAAIDVIDAGAYGITIHPRPDQRHITTTDVEELSTLLHEQYPDVELNIEGNPLASARANGYPGFDALIESARPNQCTLVPDSDGQLTSDHGWNLEEAEQRARVAQSVLRYQALGARVSLFMDPDLEQLARVPETGANRIELYTESFANAVKQHGLQSAAVAESLADFTAASQRAGELGLGVNAGHDLDLDNLPLFRRVPGILEVSIGHALISDALEMGLKSAVRAYLDVLEE
jgi:pyridoxine 5-phosphate synthase